MESKFLQSLDEDALWGRFPGIPTPWACSHSSSSATSVEPPVDDKPLGGDSKGQPGQEGTVTFGRAYVEAGQSRAGGLQRSERMTGPPG